MRIDVDGRSFDVAFNHVTYASPKRLANHLVKGGTECSVSQLHLDENGRITRNPDGSVKATVLGHGIAHCNVSDNFNKAIGRKIALKGALRDIGRNVRRSIWLAYFQRTNVGYNGKSRKETLASI